MSGNLSVLGSDAAPAQITIGNNTSNRTLTILGNLTVSGSSATSALNSLIDFNALAYSTQIKLAGNLNISGVGQITTALGNTRKYFIQWYCTTIQ